ncbi:MAG: MFS transporter [Planctomycetes bacterium]|nr:MFS transporter [Planctomycetota bacterium]
MPFHVRFRLSTMMFLQYALWGAWGTVGFIYFSRKLGFTIGETNFLFMLMPLACIVAPFIGGQIADRWFPTQYFLAFCHLASGVLLFFMARASDVGTMTTLMGAFTLLYAPTLALTNSLAFHHLKDPDRQFSGLRVWGTIGWIAAGVILTLWRLLSDPAALGEYAKEVGRSESWAQQVPVLGAAFRGIVDGLVSLSAYVQLPVVSGDLFYLAGAFAILLGLFCLVLPSTPPSKKGVNPLAFLEALKLLKDRNFSIFLVIAFIVTTELQFYYIPTSGFLEDIGIKVANVSAVMTVAQVAEIVVLAFLLPPAIKRIGLRWTLALGVIAWPLRYIIFAIGEPTWLVVAALSFHGFGYAFFFVASQIYVNNVAHSDIRASAQSLLTLVTVGIGMALGAQILTFIQTACTTGPLPGDVYSWMVPVYDYLRHLVGTDVGTKVAVNWTYLFLVPCGLTAACALAYLVLFRPPEKQLKAEGEAA